MKTSYLSIIAAVAIVMAFLSINPAFAQNAADMTNLTPQQPNKMPFQNFTTDGPVNSIVISSNDKYVVAGTQSGNDKGSVYYFDKNGTLLWNYTSDRQILSVAVSSDGSYVAAGGGQFYAIGNFGPAGIDNGMVYFFDGKGNLLWKYDTNRPYVMSVAVSSNGSYVAVGTEKNILYFDKQGKLLWSFSVQQTNIHPVAISPDGSYVATKDEATVELLDNHGNLLWSHIAGHGTQENTSAGSSYLTMSSDGRYVITSDYAEGILVFDDSGNIVLARSTGTHLFYESISSDGSFIAASAQQWGQGDPGGLYLYTKDGTRLWNYSGSAINAISADGSHVFAGKGDYQGPTLFFFDRQGNLLWNSITGPIHAVALSSNGNLAVAGAISEQYGTSSLLFFNNNANVIIPNQNPPDCTGGPGMCGQQPTPQEKHARTYLNFPFDVTTDSSGNIYVADSGNDRIVKFDSSGNYLMQFGISGKNYGQFMDPRGVAVDNQGNIYVADTENDRIQKFDSSGKFLLKFGSHGTGDGQFSGPYSVTVDKSGFVYVDDVGNARIEKFDSTGNFILKFGSRGQDKGEFDGIERIVTDNSGYLYVTSVYQGVQKFDSNGNFVQAIPLKPTLDGNNVPDAWGIALDKNGEIYVAGYNQARIQKFDSPGNFEYEFGSFGSEQGQFNHPGNIAVDNSGNILVADSDNNRIEKLDSSGKFISYIHDWNMTSKQNSQQKVPEFPFAIPILLISVASLMVFYRMRINK